MPNASSKPIRVAFLIVDLEYGGAQRVLERLVTSLDPAVFRPLVISLTLQGPVGHALARRGVRVISLGMRSPLDLVTGAVRLWWALWMTRPRILHTFLFHANVLGRVVAPWAWVTRVVSAIHTGEGRRWYLPLERLTWRLAQRVFFVSRAAARVADRRGGIRGPRTTVLYNGVPEPDPGAPDLKARLRLGAVRLVVTAGRFVRGKGFHTFLRAARALADRFPDLRFAMVGGGPLERDLRDMARDLALEHRVLFPGWQDDLLSALRGCDIFVHASRLQEGFPNAVVEAMMAGVPVVATDAGGTREALGDGGAGIILPRRDDASVVEAVAGLLEHPDRARAMGEAGRERARKLFGLEAMSAAFQKVYRELAESL